MRVVRIVFPGVKGIVEFPGVEGIVGFLVIVAADVAASRNSPEIVVGVRKWIGAVLFTPSEGLLLMRKGGAAPVVVQPAGRYNCVGVDLRRRAGGFGFGRRMLAAAAVFAASKSRLGFLLSALEKLHDPE